MDSEIFEKLPPTKLFFRLAIPSMITMAFGALYQIADGLFVGRFIGEDALAAVNLIMPIIMIVFGFANLIATGASVRTVSIIGMKLFSLSYLTGWVDMCFSSYFTALERPARSMLTSFFGTLVFPIGTLFALTPLLELNGVWLSSLVSSSASAIFSLFLYLL